MWTESSQHTRVCPRSCGGEEPWGSWNPGRKRRKRETPGIPEWGCLTSPAGWVCRVKITKWPLEKQRNIPVSILKQLYKKKKNKGRGGSFTSKSVDVTVQAPSSPPASPSPLPSKAPSHRISTGQPSTAPLLKARLCGVQGEDSPYSDLQGWQRPRALSSACRFPQPGNEVPPTRLSPSHAA